MLGRQSLLDFPAWSILSSRPPAIPIFIEANGKVIPTIQIDDQPFPNDAFQTRLVSDPCADLRRNFVSTSHIFPSRKSEISLPADRQFVLTHNIIGRQTELSKRVRVVGGVSPRPTWTSHGSGSAVAPTWLSGIGENTIRSGSLFEP